MLWSCAVRGTDHVAISTGPPARAAQLREMSTPLPNLRSGSVPLSRIRSVSLVSTACCGSMHGHGYSCLKRREQARKALVEALDSVRDGNYFHPDAVCQYLNHPCEAVVAIAVAGAG